MTINLPSPKIDWFTYLADCALYSDEYMDDPVALAELKEWGSMQFNWHAAVLKPGMEPEFDYFVKYMCDNEVKGHETMRARAIAYRDENVGSWD